MEKESDLESKYHRLAAEYSKVRSQATVLKKAVLEEQTKTVELNDLTKKHEQTIRKRDQEIESLVFRNDQLTKRVTVLQQELQINNSKKGKNKSAEPVPDVDISVLNEELQKKILENAQLFSNVAEKETEMLEYKENIKSLEDMVSNLQKELQNRETHFKEKKGSLKKEIAELKIAENLSRNKSNQSEKIKNDSWKIEADRWRTECHLLKSRPKSSDKLTDYYEGQLSSILQSKMGLHSEIKTLCAENMSLQSRLEHILTKYGQLKDNIKTSCEELTVTNENYKTQLDVLTEHLAAQNETITQQCDEIQILKHRLSLKK